MRTRSVKKNSPTARSACTERDDQAELVCNYDGITSLYAPGYLNLDL